MIDFVNTILACTDRRRSARRFFTQSWDLVRTWQALHPVEHRLAMPSVVLLAYTCIALLWGWPAFAALTAIGWTAFLRPKEMFDGLRRHLVLPRDVAGSDSRLWYRVPEPKTRFRGPRQQLARSDERWVVSLADAVFGPLPADSPLWQGSTYAFRKRWKCIGEALAIPTGGKGITPASLRAGGVTAYYLSTEDIPRLLRRARWATAQQLTTYVQEVSPLEFLSKLPIAHRDRLTRLAALLPDVLQLALNLLHANVPTTLWYGYMAQRLEALITKKSFGP